AGEVTSAGTIAAELGEQEVEVIDVAPALREVAPVSSVTVLEATGERSVIGGDATSLHAPRPDPAQMRDLLTGADIVLLDGHHPQLARAVRDAAAEADVPSVHDA